MRMVKMTAVIAATALAVCASTAVADDDSSEWFLVDTTESVSVAIGSSEWFFVDTAPSVAVHFDANGGVFVGMGENVTQCDQSFTRGEPQALYADDLVPVKSGSVFTGWFTAASGGLWIREGDVVDADCSLFAHWTAMTREWLERYPQIAAESGGDIATAANLTAANGRLTVSDCYAVGINPEDPDDDFRITSFRMEGAKPIITVNHTEDGSGESLLPRMKTLGKAELSGEWEEVPEEGNPDHRFFTVAVEAP